MVRWIVNRQREIEALPFDLNAVKAHLRVTFDDDDRSITRIGKAAAAEIEQVAQIALLTQTITVVIFEPTCEGGLRLPIGPVSVVDAPTVTIDGTAFTAFDFVAGVRPYLHWQSEYFNLTPTRLEIEYQAGFGVTAASIPHDLSQALMDQAALHYDARSPLDVKGQFTNSPHMARIAARYRGVQA